MSIVYKKSEGLVDIPTHYCPGCTHGVIHKLVAESLEELDLLGKTIGVAPVGCAVLAYKYFNVDMHEAAHGRAPAVATGIKRVLPNSTVFTYQGDGDLASIGMAEIVHAAARGENITVIFVNNAIYGMTGGQMAPTTLAHQKTTTSKEGRNEKIQGYPLHISEMLSEVRGSYHIERCSVHDPGNIRKTKKAIKKAFEFQEQGKGFTLIEVLSTCPTNWGMTPVESLKWVKENMLRIYPLGVYKNGER